MNNVAQNSIDSLRNAGYAVTIFYPEELNGVDPRQLENRLVELGTECIQDLRD
jgi:hypothetical protein